jgi:hypothetical protein
MRNSASGRLLRAADKDRNGHLWFLALSGLRRGEIAGSAGRREARARAAYADSG